MKTVAVLQSNYIPWKGYFDIIHDADEFIFYDEVQFTYAIGATATRSSRRKEKSGLQFPLELMNAA